MNIAKTHRTIICLATTIIFTGCATYPHVEWHEAPIDQIDTPPLITLVDALETADRMAEEELKRVNAEWSVRDRLRHDLPFLLSDYDKRVSQYVSENNDRKFIIWYDNRRPLGFFGHPEHFDITINRNTGEAELTGGH